MVVNTKLPNHSVYQLKGDVYVQEAAALRQELLQRIEEGSREIVLDVSGVTFLDSAGLGVMVTVHKRLRAVGGHFIIQGVKGSVLELFQTARLHRVFQIR
ncbi:anti-sigma factor antagonist [Halobacillus fulvus]|nr:anti-sigma factor antagonist [Halobacillus fulvus]